MSPWIPLAGFGDIPWVMVIVTADKGGSFQVFDSEALETQNQIGGSPVPAGNVPTGVAVPVNRAQVQVKFTAGVIDSACSITLWAPNLVALSQLRILELILREMRANSLLLSTLKEPTPSTVNLPFGPTNSTN